MRASRFALLVTIVCAIVYFPAVHGAPIWDDHDFVFNNPLVTSPDGLGRIWLSTENADYWPITYSCFWVLHAVFGDATTAFHVLNVVVHAAGALALFWMLRELGLEHAWVAALLFALHPVQVEAVAWIIQLKTVLATAFGFSAGALFLRWERDGRAALLAAAAVVFAAAMASKTSAVTLPVCFLLLRRTRRGLIGASVLGAIGLGFGLVAVWFHRLHYLVGTAVVRDDTFVERVVTAGWAVWFYLLKAVVPYPTAFVYPRWEVDVSSPTAWLPLVALAIAFVLIRRWPAVLLAASIYVLQLAPVVGFVDIPFMQFSLVADHWQYAALAAPLALVAYVLRNVETKRVVVLAAIVGVAYGALSFARAGRYVSEVAVFRATAEHNPDSLMVQINLGRALIREGDKAGARRAFEAAVAIDGSSAVALNNLAGILAEDGDPEGAARHLRLSLEANPDQSEAAYNLGNLLARIGRHEEAIPLFERAVANEPDRVEAQNNLGSSLAAVGRNAEAAAAFAKAVALAPNEIPLAINLGRAQLAAGRNAEAVATFERLVAANPTHLRATLGLGFAYANAGRDAEAIAIYEKAIELAPPEQHTEIRGGIEQLRQRIEASKE